MDEIQYIEGAISSADDGPAAISTQYLVAGFVETLIREAAYCQGMEATIPTTPESSSREERSPSYLTKELVLAGIWHCMELLHAQRLGVSDVDSIRRNVFLHEDDHRLVLPAEPRQTAAVLEIAPTTRNSVIIPVIDGEEEYSSSFGTSLTQMLPIPTRPLAAAAASTIPILTLDPTTASVEEESAQQWRIARSAAHMVRVELLARAVATSPALSTDDSSRLRGLLLTVPDFDWRSLLLRCVACLYCLEQCTLRTPAATRTAREGLQVYGSFAEQLGLPGLKARIEDAAFRILYQRQYATVKSMMMSSYHGPQSSMQGTATFLEAHIKAALYADDLLRSQEAEVFVTSRVKEPFSLWKKLVKKRGEKLRTLGSKTETRSSLVLKNGSSSQVPTSLVPDFVALRVVLNVNKVSPHESPEATKAREQLLCYYIQEKIQALWPVQDRARIKDYIKSPKANGYQSLHFTSKVSFGGFDLPFEVQVRTNEMHVYAEFGAASHWGYKLGAASGGSKLIVANSRDDVCPIPVEATDVSAASGNPYLNALDLSRRSTEQQTIFVFTSNVNEPSSGNIMALPYRTKLKDLVATDQIVLLNGEFSCEDAELKSGDVVLFS